MNRESHSLNNRFKSEELTFDPGPPRLFTPEKVKTFVTTLGTGTPSPNPFRFGPAGAVIVEEFPYLIDAGEGILRSMAKAAINHNRRFVDCFAPRKLTRLFLTHLHSDHVVGLPSIMLFPWIFGKEEPLEIYGPPGTSNLIDKLLEGYEKDIHERIHGPERANDTGWRVKVSEFSGPGLIYEDNRVKVETFTHSHGTLQNFGFRFSTENRVIVWAGDGKVSEGFQRAAHEADVLVSELCSLQTLEKAPWGGLSAEEKETIVWSYHLKPQELAKLALEANVKLLVLIHESNYSSPFVQETLLQEIKQFYPGPVISSRDGDFF